MQMSISMKGKVDRKDLDRWFRVITLGIYKDVIIGTPVDTGRARANWQLAIGNAPQGVVDKLDKGGRTGSELGKGDRKLKARSVGRSAFIVNNLGYIVALEEGHSSQNKGWVQKAMDRAEARILAI